MQSCVWHQHHFYTDLYSWLVLNSGQLHPPVPKELVLDYIIERKRIDDLCGSIIDGRFREQKVWHSNASNNLVNTVATGFFINLVLFLSLSSA